MNKVRRAAINLKALIILAAAVGVVGGGVAGVHYVRKRSMASEAFAKGKAAFAAQKWEEASRQLKTYLSKCPQDEQALADYCAACLRTRPATPTSVMSAISGYRRLLLRFRPGDPAICEQLCKLYFQVGDYNELKYICAHWRSAHPEAAGTALWMAKALIAQNDHDKATAELRAWVDRDPKADVEAYRLLGAAAMQRDTDEGRHEALDWMTRCVEAHPESARALALRAQLQTLRRPIGDAEREAARADLEVAERLPDGDPLATLMVSDIWLDLMQFDRAEAALRRVEKVEPVDLERLDIDEGDMVRARWQGAARVALRRGDTSTAADLAEHALAELTGAGRDRFLSTAVRLLLLSDKLDRAKVVLDEYAAVLNRAGGTGTVIEEFALLRARIAAAENRPQDVLALLDTFVARGASDPAVYSVAAWAHQAAGRSADARKLWERYVQEVPDDSDALLNLAATFEGENWPEALRYAAAAERSKPSPANKLARIEAQIMQVGEGTNEEQTLRNCHAELVSLRDQNPKAADVRVLLASVLHLMHRVDDAAAELQSGLRECDDTLPLLLAAADLHERSGNVAQAMAACRQAIDAHPAQANPRVTLARLQRAAGDADGASATLEQACAALAGEELAEAHDALVRHLLATNRIDDATATLKRLADQQPDNVAVRCRLLTMPEVRQNAAYADRLVAEIRAAEETHPGAGGGAAGRWQVAQARLWLDRGEWAAHAREIEEALSQYTGSELAATDWFWTDAVEGLVLLHGLTGRPQEAERVLRAAFARSPRSSGIADALLKNLERQGKYVEAEDVLAHMPRGDERIDQHRVGVSLARGEFDGATAALKRKVAADPKDTASRVLLASLMFNREKDKARALALLDEAAKISPDELEVARLRLAILTSAGDMKAADNFINGEVERRKDFPIHWLRGRYHEELGHAAKAEDDFRALTTFENAGASGHGLYGRFLARKGRTADAIRAWEEGLVRTPEDTDLQRVLISVLLARSDEPARLRGRELLAKLRAKAEGDAKFVSLLPEVMRFEAQALADGGREGAAQAEALLIKVVEKEPRDVLAWRQLAMLARDGGDLEKAKSIVTQALAANPHHPDLSMMLASAENDLGNTGVARSLAQSVRESQPGHLESRLLLAQLLLGGGDINSASQVMNEATSIAPKHEAVQVARSTVMLAMGRVDEAIENLRSFIDEEGGAASVEAALMLARLHIAKGQYAPADARLRSAERLAPDDPRVTLARMNWHAAQRQFDPIAAAAEAYYPRKKGFAEVVTGAAYILAGSNEPQRAATAAALFGRVAQAQPDHPAGHLGAARVHYGEGRVEDAVKAYRRVLEIDAYHTEALNDLAWILGERGNEASLKEADALATRGVDTHPGHAHLRDTRGVIRHRIGRLDESRQDLEQSLRLAPPRSPTQVRALLHLARVLDAQGNADGARMKAEEALKTDEKIKCLSPKEQTELQRFKGQ